MGFVIADEDIVYENVPDWDMFVEIIDDIVDNKTTDYPELKAVFIDTIDNNFSFS